ncbi:helix-turn-helix transcriptional regulator [uncultured Photobacterium sp.]|uniref:helix-turn-helix transcriptional regulator n=1 Tax=uncultured Photobacterium sp. TaxID=173973 RepID=UPI0026241581|nr:helix-turn-helix transcriptional regulator [uncultured Photobacterium sp.]
MDRTRLWVQALLEAGQTEDELNKVLKQIGDHLGADLSLFFWGSPPRSGKFWTLRHGIEEGDYQFYLRHSNDDAYLKHYLSHALSGQMVLLQEMLPLKQIHDGWFREEMLPRLGIRHSISGLYPIAPGQMLAITFHRYHQPFNHKSKRLMQQLLDQLIPWCQFFIARDKLENLYGSAPVSRSIMKLPEILTQAEHHVVSLLAQGYDGSEVTEMRGVSKETTKSQIKSILRKTDCRHQNQLLHKIYSGD